MKILQVINSVSPAGGGPIEGIKQQGLALAMAGHKVEIACLDAPQSSYVHNFPLPVYPLGPAMLKYAFGVRFVPWLITNRSHYDVVVVNGIWQFHSFAVWKALRKSNTPYVVFPHGMLDPWFKRQHPLKHMKKWLYWPWADYRVLRDAQAVLFTAEEERRLARDSFWLYRCNELVVGYGTARSEGFAELERAEFLARYPELGDKKLALFLGRIHPKKGCDLCLEAFARVLGKDHRWHLVLAGPDQLGWQKQLSARAQELGLASRTTWTGMLQGALKWGALHAAEVFLLPSHQENFGVAVAEALAAGVPVLISNKVNIWREVKQYGAGLIGEDDLAGACALMAAYAGMADEAKAAMRNKAQRCFEENFEIKRTAMTLHAILARVTGEDRVSKPQ